MSFFIVDDGFSSHDKVSKLLEAARPDRSQTRFLALSLWVLAGSECARRRNGGRVSRMLARTLLNVTGRQAVAAAELLVEVALWERNAHGYAFHDWASRQRPRDKATLVGQVSDECTASGEPTNDECEANIRQVNDKCMTSVAPVTCHESSTIPGTSDPVPLSSLLSPVSASEERGIAISRALAARANLAMRGPDDLTKRCLAAFDEGYASKSAGNRPLGVRGFAADLGERVAAAAAMGDPVEIFREAGVGLALLVVESRRSGEFRITKPWRKFLDEPLGAFLGHSEPLGSATPAEVALVAATKRFDAANAAYREGLGEDGTTERKAELDAARLALSTLQQSGSR